MEGQTKSLANPKRKEKKKKEKEKKIRMLLTVARIGIETKGKRSKGEKRTLKGGKLGSAAAHRPPEKATTSKESKCLGGKFLRNNKMCLSKKGESV